MSRIRSWLKWVLLLLVLASAGMWILMRVTTPVLHPNPQAVPSVTGTTSSPPWSEAVDRSRAVIRASLAEQNLPGLSVAVGIDGEIVWTEGFGFADLKSSVPVRPDHRFRIGTASTVLTSAAAGLLLEDGRLKLDDEIQTFVKPAVDSSFSVTLRQLMGHTPGVTPDDNDEAPLFTKHCERPVEAVQHFENWLYADGYSIYDWILVSAAIEAAANQPFLTFMREQVFEPLGMRDTIADPRALEAQKAIAGEDFPLVNLVRELIYDPGARRDTPADSTKAPAQDRVTSYFPRLGSDPNYGLHVMRPVDYSCYAGSSVFVSTPSDLVRFGMAMNGGKLLQPATLELLQKSQRLASGEETGYGLGWDIETVTLAGKQTRAIGHSGDSMGGMVASLITFPEYRMAVAVTSNISHADTFPLAVKIADAFAQDDRRIAVSQDSPNRSLSKPDFDASREVRDAKTIVPGELLLRMLQFEAPYPGFFQELKLYRDGSAVTFRNVPNWAYQASAFARLEQNELGGVRRSLAAIDLSENSASSSPQPAGLHTVFIFFDGQAYQRRHFNGPLPANIQAPIGVVQAAIKAAPSSSEQTRKAHDAGREEGRILRGGSDWRVPEELRLTPLKDVRGLLLTVSGIRGAAATSVYHALIFYPEGKLAYQPTDSANWPNNPRALVTITFEHPNGPSGIGIKTVTHEVVIEYRLIENTLNVGSQSFPLATGNLFVIRLDKNWVPVVRAVNTHIDGPSMAPTILEEFKTQLRTDEAIQSLRLGG
jgi:serine beta-lactamase-like protein LACTB